MGDINLSGRVVGVTPTLTPRRIHELALQKWLYSVFPVQDGFPTPVVFAAPQDAYASYSKIWEKDGNPFAYLLKMKDNSGKFVRPFPSPPIYPLISVTRVSSGYRAQQGQSIRRERVFLRSFSKNDLPQNIPLSVMKQMGIPWNFTWNIVHHARSMETHAIFEHQFIRSLGFSSGTCSTFIPVLFPGVYGLRYLRATFGDLADNSPEATTEEQREFWWSFSVTLEGWSFDLDEQWVPNFWTFVLGVDAVSPGDLESLFDKNITL